VGVQGTVAVQGCQSRRVVYVVQVGSVVQNHLHDWGAMPPVTAAVTVIGVPSPCGLTGAAVRLEMTGGTLALPIVFL